MNLLELINETRDKAIQCDPSPMRDDLILVLNKFVITHAKVEQPKEQPMDDIAAQSFKQFAREKWQYEIKSKQGKQFTVDYIVQPFGYVKEILTQSGTLIWDRECKIGQNFTPTIYDYIREGKV